MVADDVVGVQSIYEGESVVIEIPSSSHRVMSIETVPTEDELRDIFSRPALDGAVEPAATFVRERLARE